MSKEIYGALSVALGGAMLVAGIANLSDEASAADVVSSQPVRYAQSLPGGIGRALGRRLGGGNRLPVGSGLGTPKHPAYDKVVETANAIAIETFAHENPHKVGGSGPKDPFTDLLQVRLVVQEIKECQDAVAAALAAGIPGGTPVVFNTQGSSLVSPTPLSEMSDKVCGKYKELAETTLNGKVQAANAERDRFLNVLSGDRKSVFAEYNMHKRAVKGPGGRNLLKPQDYVAAPRWYTYGNVANSYPEQWYVHGWVFSGNKLQRETNNEGFGHNPPSSAFP